MIATFILLTLQGPAAQPPASGWTETRFDRVHLRNGNFVDGHLLTNEPDYVTIRVKTGELEIARELILKVEIIRMRSYAEKPVAVPVPEPAPPVGEARPPVIVAAPSVPGPVQVRVTELLAQARHLPAERKEQVLNDLAALGYEGALMIISLAEKLNDDDLRFVGRALRQVRSPALVDPVKSMLLSASPVVRAEAVATLASLGVESDRLADPSPVVRVAALESAAIFKSRSVFERAASMCADPHPELRRQALRTSFLLARQHDLGQALAEALARVLGGEANTNARVELLDALGRLRNPASWSAAAEELRREEPEVRVAAARCLGELRTTDATEVMADAIASETVSEVKVALAEAAGKLGDGELVPELIARLTDPDPKVVRASADALTRITKQNHGFSRARWQEYWARVQNR